MRKYVHSVLFVLMSASVVSCATLEGQMMLRKEIAELTESNKKDQTVLVALVSSNTFANEFDRLLDDLLATELTKDQYFGIKPSITKGQLALKTLNNEEATEEEITKANTDLGNAMVEMRRWHARIFPSRAPPVIPTDERPPS